MMTVSPALESLGYGLKELVDRWTQRLVQPVSVRGFHHNVFGMRWRCGAAQQRTAGVPKVTGKQHTGRVARF